MLKRFSNPISPLDLYFKEAPGDEGDSVSVTVAPRKNRGTDYADDTNNVTVGPRANRGTDYGADDDNDAPAEDAAPEADTGDAPAPDTGDDDGTDYAADDGDTEGGDDTGEDAGGDTAEDDGADGDAPAPDTGDDEGTDYSADDGGGGEEGGDNAGGDAGGDSNGDNMSPEEKAEAYKKFHMYKRYMHLYNVLEAIIDKCRSIVKPDASQNAVIKTVTNTLSDLYDNMFDYMTIKYKNATYVQILLYFETAISIIQLNFELLKNNKINLKQ